MSRMTPLTHLNSCSALDRAIGVSTSIFSTDFCFGATAEGVGGGLLLYLLLLVKQEAGATETDCPFSHYFGSRTLLFGVVRQGVARNSQDRIYPWGQCRYPMFSEARPRFSQHRIPNASEVTCGIADSEPCTHAVLPDQVPKELVTYYKPREAIRSASTHHNHRATLNGKKKIEERKQLNKTP
ncbi:hypothetical protein J6590_043868 [Homalodisca vitripennis]|nr:hypothetical protein J6590_043868 [Homalodisca vitripennis]